MVFAFTGSLDLRPVVSPPSGRGLASYSMGELALQSGFEQECLTYARSNSESMGYVLLSPQFRVEVSA